MTKLSNEIHELNIDEISDKELDTVVGGSFDIEQVQLSGARAAVPAPGK